MLKQKISGSVQEVILPDFPDDDNTVTTTVTKSRRVSFGPNFVKEFIVDSAVSAQCMSEYEQPFPSSDSSNADSSHSAVGQSTFVVHENVKVHKSVPAEPENTEIRPKPPKFASTICFSADSPTADMEFTEGCITLAKSILDKKNKEMTVFIQAKPKGQKEEEKPKEDETNYFEGSQFEMSMTRCLKSKEKKREEKRFASEKTKIFGKFDDEMSMTRCEKFFNDDESDNSWEDSKENRMPLDAIMRHLDKDSSDLDLFNPERTFGKLLGANPFDLSDESEKLNLNESMEISGDLQGLKVPLSVAQCEEKLDEIPALNLFEKGSHESVGGFQPPQLSDDKIDSDVLIQLESSEKSESMESPKSNVFDAPENPFVEEICAKTLQNVDMSLENAKEKAIASSNSCETLKSNDAMDGSMVFQPDLSDATGNPDGIIVDKMEEIICTSLSNLSKAPEMPTTFDENATDLNFLEKSKSSEAMEISFDIQQGFSAEIPSPSEKEEIRTGELASNEIGELAAGVLGNPENSQHSKSFVKLSSCETSEIESAVLEIPLSCGSGVSPLKLCDTVNMSAELQGNEYLENRPLDDIVDDPGTEKLSPDETMEIGRGVEEHVHPSPPEDRVTSEEPNCSPNDMMEVTTDVQLTQNKLSSEDNNVESRGMISVQEDDSPREPSLRDLKVIESLKEQSKEPGCVWRLKDIQHPQKKVQGLLSFSCRLLESTTSIEFVLKMSDEDSLDSCSIVTGGKIFLDEEKQYRVPEYTLAVGFGFEELKIGFEERRQQVETMRHVPYFLDHINSLLSKMNAYLRQIHSVLTSYPGSRLTGRRLSFRLFSFPIFFSCVVFIELSNVFRLTKASLSFEHDFGCLDENKIGEIFEECLKGENSLCEFIVQSTRYLMELERQSGYLSKRGHIRLLPDELKS